MSLDKTKSYIILIDRNRSKSWEYYYPVLKKSDLDGLQYKTLSEYVGCDFHYNVSKPIASPLTPELWDFFRSLDCTAIIDRCRVLRQMDTEKAREQIKRALVFCFNFFESRHIDTLITFCVDRYTLDILVRVAWHFKVEVVGVGGSFIKGSRRLTVYGELQSVRQASEEEVEEMYQKLQKPFASSGKPSIHPAQKAAFLMFASAVVRYVLHFLILHKLFGKVQYDYLLVKQQPRSFLYNYFFYNKKPFQVLQEADLEKKLWPKRVYIPLHWHPEATVDYWTDSPEKAYYLDSLCEVIARYEEMGYQVVLKEHPAMYLSRHASFYKTLRAYNNVLLVWPFLETLHVLKCIDKVIIWTGTTGIEAAVNGKDVYLYSRNFWDNGFFKNWREIELPSRIDGQQARKIVRGFLENIIRE